MCPKGVLMDRLKKILNNQLGFCVFPVGDCKSLCGEPTLLDANGNYSPFCAKHAKEVEQRFKHELQKKGKKKKGFKGVARKYV